MNILYFVDSWYPAYGGGTRGLEQLAKGLVERGHHVTIITRDLRSREKAVPPLYPDPPYKVIKLGPPSSFANPLARIWWLFYATIVGLQQSFDVIHARANLGGIPGKLVSWLTRKPVVYSVHGSTVHAWDKMGKTLSNKINKHIEYFVQCKIFYDTEISVDSSFFDIPGNVNKHTLVIPNGVDTNRFKPEPENKIAGRILFVGRLDAVKGLSTLLEAFSLIREEQLYLHIVGSGGEEMKLKKLQLKMGLHDKVTFIGPVHGQDLIKEYQAAELFVLPSLSEGQAHTILEAWSTGVPVVATRVGANPEMFTDSFLGKLVLAQEPKQLAAAILEMMQRSDLHQLGMSSRQHVLDHYSWDWIVEKYEALYQTLISA